MEFETLTAIVTLLVTLSIASERLVEIVKGLCPWLNTEHPDATREGRRRAALHLLAVIAGWVTACLAGDVIAALKIPGFFAPDGGITCWQCVGLGLLASGGSGLWNSVLSYLVKVKDLKGEQVAVSKLQVASLTKTAG